MRSAGDVGAELKELAKHPAYRNVATTLDRLADDLESGSLTQWRRVDMLAMCDLDSVLGGERQSRTRILGHIDLARNLLLFLPLLLTWGGIYFAVQAYRTLLGAPAAEQAQFADASFLQMWTRGFGGRTWVTLDVVALLDFLAILAVILLFVGGTWLQRRVAASDAADRQANVVRLRSVLVDANLVVANEDETVVDRLVANTKELLQVCDDTLRRLFAAQKDLTDSVDSGKQSMAELAGATKELARSGTAIAKSAERLNIPAENLAKTAHTVETATGALVRNTTEITGHLPSVRQGLTDVLAGIQALSTELRDLYTQQINGMKEQTPVYHNAIRQLAAAQKSLVESLEAGRGNMSDLAEATGRLATSGTAIADSSQDLRQHIDALTTATGKFDRTVDSLVNGAGAMTDRLSSSTQGMLDVLASVQQLGAKLDDLYARQEVIAQELGVLADNPLAAAEAAKRTAVAARASEDALREAITALPKQMDQLREAVVVSLDRELQERQVAARALAGTGEATRLAIQAALGTLLASSREASDALRQSVEQLRDSPRHVLPDLNQVAGQLSETLDHSRVLVDTLVRTAETNGRRPRRWWPWSSRHGTRP